MKDILNQLEERRAAARLGGGQRRIDAQHAKGFPANWQGARSANITAHPTAGIGAWTDDEIRRAITQGISRGGRRLQPPMPFSYYARLSRADLDAIVAYLRTVPPQQ